MTRESRSELNQRGDGVDEELELRARPGEPCAGGAELGLSASRAIAPISSGTSSTIIDFVAEAAGSLGVGPVGRELVLTRPEVALGLAGGRPIRIAIDASVRVPPWSRAFVRVTVGAVDVRRRPWTGVVLGGCAEAEVDGDRWRRVAEAGP